MISGDVGGELVLGEEKEKEEGGESGEDEVGFLAECGFVAGGDAENEAEERDEGSESESESESEEGNENENGPASERRDDIVTSVVYLVCVDVELYRSGRS